jgi:hypothetical protein
MKLAYIGFLLMLLGCKEAVEIDLKDVVNIDDTRYSNAHAEIDTFKLKSNDILPQELIEASISYLSLYCPLINAN